MDSLPSIIVRGNGKDVRIVCEANGVVSEDALRRAFLLENNIPISLLRDNVALNCRHEGGSYMFLLGPDWNDKTFEVQWEEHRRSHPVIPGLPVLTDSPILVSRGNEIELMKQYVYMVDGIVACATAIGVHILASCYHCIKHCVATCPSVDEISSHRKAIIDLTHAVTGRKIKARIRIYSIEKDVVLLQTEENLMSDDELRFHDPSLGEPYYILGTPISDDGNHLQVISGRISAVLPLNFSRSSGHSLRGHESARPGASGGPVFARHLFDARPVLLGIVVGGQNISHETTLLTFVSSSYVKIISYVTLWEVYKISEGNTFKI